MKKTEILIKQTRTKSGLQCQRWDSQSPHKHKFTDVANFPDANLEDAGSFCRCPESSPFCYPWCFTRDPDTRAEECDMDRLQQGRHHIHGPLARYVKLRVAHASGMPGTFSPPTWVSDPDMHHGTCLTHVPWSMSGSLTSGFFWSQVGENVPGTPGACATRTFKCLVRGPWLVCYLFVTVGRAHVLKQLFHRMNLFCSPLIIIWVYSHMAMWLRHVFFSYKSNLSAIVFDRCHNLTIFNVGYILSLFI